MKKLMAGIRSYLLDNLPQLDTVVRKSREDEEIPEIDKFGVSIEFGTSMNYKDRAKRKETLFFLNCFCHGDEKVKADLDVLELAEDVAQLMNRADFSTSELKIYDCRYTNSPEKPEYKSELNAFEQIVEIQVRWTTDV
ncbi:MAG: hypothetical protein R6V17_07375 [Halanaerobacter sp.]